MPATSSFLKDQCQPQSRYPTVMSLLVERSFASGLRQPGDSFSPSLLLFAIDQIAREGEYNNIDTEADYEKTEAVRSDATGRSISEQDDDKSEVCREGWPEEAKRQSKLNGNSADAERSACSDHDPVNSPVSNEAMQEEARPLTVPTALAEFEIIKALGVGMIGRVFLIRNRATDEYLAMKIMPKKKVIEMHQVEHVLNERNILSSGIKHPFIVSMFTTSSDNDFLYILMEFLPGGDLFHHIRARKRFTEDTARFYAMQVISAIGYLHSRSIVYRDLKPENVMLDETGFIKLVDFGFSKKVTHSTWTLCGTPKYLAPEIILSKAYTKSVDWWTVGILIYEMLVGHPPFNDPDLMNVYMAIVGGKIEWPPDPFSQLATVKDLIQRFLCRDHRKRLGSSRNGFSEVKRHGWFQSLKWDLMDNKAYPPPLGPFPKKGEKYNSNAAKTYSKWKNTILKSQTTGNPTQQCFSSESPDPFADF